MNVFKFDEEKVKNIIEAYKEQHGKYPYLICNIKTAELISKQINKERFLSKIELRNETTLSIQKAIRTIQLDDKEYVMKDDIEPKFADWNGAKILIDDSLEYGEMHIG